MIITQNTIFPYYYESPRIGIKSPLKHIGLTQPVAILSSRCILQRGINKQFSESVLVRIRQWVKHGMKKPTILKV